MTIEIIDNKETIKALSNVQQALKAPKSQFNKFGNYKYRNCEDILESVKPLLAKENAVITINDNIIELGGTLMIEATAIFTNENGSIHTTAYAGIDPNRKGMDIAQSFGSSSSYARKYALNGLLLIDDSKDADSTNTHGKDTIKADDEKRSKLIAEFKSLAKGSDNEKVLEMVSNVDKYSDILIQKGIDKLKV